LGQTREQSNIEEELKDYIGKVDAGAEFIITHDLFFGY